MSKYTLHLGDCLEYMRGMEAGSVDAVVTDPPYPDYHTNLYGFDPDMLPALLESDCRQFVFWSAKATFPMSYTAVHIWDKKTGAGSEYERLFERNGNKAYKVFRHYLINSTVAASYAGDTYTGHPSQKPLRLLFDVIRYGTRPGDTIFDPFMGSGTTGVACMQLGRSFIGCEIDPDYFAIAEKRISEAAKQPPLFTSEPQGPAPTQPGMWDTEPGK